MDINKLNIKMLINSNVIVILIMNVKNYVVLMNVRKIKINVVKNQIILKNIFVELLIIFVKVYAKKKNVKIDVVNYKIIKIKNIIVGEYIIV